MRARRRKGAEATARRLRGQGLNLDDLPPPTSPQAAERWAEVVGRAVASGTLTHSQGKAISSLLREWRASHEAGEVAERVDDLRRQVAELKKGRGLKVVE